MRNPFDKIFNTLKEAVQWRDEQRKNGRTVAVTNGCFDIMHRGHAQYLYNAAAEADCLMVLVNSDESIAELKGPDRPVVEEVNRTYMLASLECVDAVVVFNDERATGEFEAIKPDVYVKGADYTEDTLNREEYAVLKSGGAVFKFIEFVPGCSTTNIIKKIKAED
jgi:rfaE bifunctional protein nucleotidyltransferase chain/domain